MVVFGSRSESAVGEARDGVGEETVADPDGAIGDGGPVRYEAVIRRAACRHSLMGLGSE